MSAATGRDSLGFAGIMSSMGASYSIVLLCYHLVVLTTNGRL